VEFFAECRCQVLAAKLAEENTVLAALVMQCIHVIIIHTFDTHYLSGARCTWFAYGPADVTATHHLLLQ